jgi:uncharacterized protein (DUF39 family)
MVEAERSSRRQLENVRSYIGGLYGPDLHAKRVDALASATLGVMTGASLAVNMPEHRLAPLMAKFAEAVSNTAEFSSVFAAGEMRG